jgi:hypothetical protein
MFLPRLEICTVWTGLRALHVKHLTPSIPGRMQFFYAIHTSLRIHQFPASSHALFHVHKAYVCMYVFCTCISPTARMQHVHLHLRGAVEMGIIGGGRLERKAQDSRLDDCHKRWVHTTTLRHVCIVSMCVHKTLDVTKLGVHIYDYYAVICMQQGSVEQQPCTHDTGRMCPFGGILSCKLYAIITSA